MPLPPLPENNTDRAWLKYTSMGTEHEIVFRFVSSTTQAAIVTALTGFANSMKALLPTTDSFTGLRHQDSGSTISFPLSWAAIAGTNSGTPAVVDEAKFMSLTGRSLSGYRCRLTFFYPYVPTTLAYRQARGSGTHADMFLDAVDALGSAVCAIDGNQVVWNQYANNGTNAYWTRQLRT